MTNSIADKLATLGHQLPQPSAPAANYVSVVRTGNLLFVAGQVSIGESKEVMQGRLGADLDVERGQLAAQRAAIGVLAHIAAATNGQLSAVRRIVRLGVFVAATPDFTKHPEVANGASDLIAAVFGERGKHARATVGVASLPRGAAVEVDAIVELEG
jgi:enamine deaminase RidA (YjgF/YER057c/UK114 family)